MRGFVFDLDNTLFDRYATITKILTDDYEVIKPYLNIAYDLDRALEHVLHTEPLHIINGWHGVYEYLCYEHFFNADNTPDYERFSDYVHRKFMEVAVAFPFTYRLLADIKAAGYKLGIITNGGSDIQRKKIEMLGFEDIFDQILISGEFALEKCGDSRNYDFWKPNRAVFDEMSCRLNIPAKELYYVGDNPQNDIEAAKKSDYVPVWIMSRSPWPYDNSEIPEHRFYGIEGLRELI